MAAGCKKFNRKYTMDKESIYVAAIKSINKIITETNDIYSYLSETKNKISLFFGEQIGRAV